MCFDSIRKLCFLVLSLVRGDAIVHYERAPFNIDEHIEDEFSTQDENNVENNVDNNVDNNIENNIENIIENKVKDTNALLSDENEKKKRDETLHKLIENSVSNSLFSSNTSQFVSAIELEYSNSDSDSDSDSAYPFSQS